MCENVTATFTLLALDQFYISFHTFRRETSREKIGDIGVGMKTRELQLMQVKRQSAKEGNASK